MPASVNQYITDINADSDLAVALTSFAAVCSANSAALGLTPATLAEITGTNTAYGTSLNAWVTARVASFNAQDAKDLQKKTSKAVISKFAKQFRANQAISDSLLAQLQLAPHKPPKNASPPAQPTQLTANANGLGFVKLKWSRKGNKPNTTYQIEYRSEAVTSWTILDSTTKAKFEYQADPGQSIQFRIIASRAGLASEPSVPVSLWEVAPSAISNLKLAA
ncbi:MAG: fibronectin type III domain-containing protein [Fimbriimonadaceae bacterium]